MSEVNYDGYCFCNRNEPGHLGGVLRKWQSVDIAWGIKQDLPQFSHDSLKAVITEAFARWSRVCGIRPTFTEDWKQANIIIQLQPANEVDGPGGVLADCQLPMSGDVKREQLNFRFDYTESYCISDNPPPNKLDIVRIACHELGHALGSDHIEGPNLMAPTYSLKIKDPQMADRATMVARYGLPLAEPAPSPMPPTAEQITELAAVLFRGGRLVVRIMGREVSGQ